jgi:hypothetical protein
MEDRGAVADVIAELDREHPPIVDRFGREWIWRGGDLYTHDDTLTFPRSFITSTEHPIGLPGAGLAGNPNYSKLCEICRSEWPK